MFHLDMMFEGHSKMLVIIEKIYYSTTHRSGNTLNLIIPLDDINVGNVTSMPTEISDHYTVTCTINTHNINLIDKQTSVLRKIRPFRKLDHWTLEQFAHYNILNKLWKHTYFSLHIDYTDGPRF